MLWFIVYLNRTVCDFSVTTIKSKLQYYKLYLQFLFLYLAWIPLWFMNRTCAIDGNKQNNKKVYFIHYYSINTFLF